MNFALEEYGIGSRCFEQPEPLRRNESNKTSSSAVDFFKGVEGKRGGLCYKVRACWGFNGYNMQGMHGVLRSVIINLQ